MSSNTTYTERIMQLSCPFDNEYQGVYSRYLFVCSAGMLRSPTGAAVASELGFNARSCGSKDYALIPLSVNLINWADKIFFVQEDNYYDARETFQDDKQVLDLLASKAKVLDIEDEYEFMHPELVQTFQKILT